MFQEVCRDVSRGVLWSDVRSVQTDVSCRVLLGVSRGVLVFFVFFCLVFHDALWGA